MAEIDEAIAVLPALAKADAIPELMVETTVSWLLKAKEIVGWQLDKDNLQLSRLIHDAGADVGKLLARVSEANMRHSARNDLIEQMAARIAELEGKG